MNSTDFVFGLKRELVDKGHQTYIDLYENPRKTSEETVFFQALQSDQKRVLLKIIKQVQVDTVASFLSLLDGHFLRANQTSDYRLTMEEAPDKKLNTNLFDDFLELVDTDDKNSLSSNSEK